MRTSGPIRVARGIRSNRRSARPAQTRRNRTLTFPTRRARTSPRDNLTHRRRDSRLTLSRQISRTMRPRRLSQMLRARHSKAPRRPRPRRLKLRAHRLNKAPPRRLRLRPLTPRPRLHLRPPHRPRGRTTAIQCRIPSSRLPTCSAARPNRRPRPCRARRALIRRRGNLIRRKDRRPMAPQQEAHPRRHLQAQNPPTRWLIRSNRCSKSSQTNKSQRCTALFRARLKFRRIDLSSDRALIALFGCGSHPPLP